MRVGDLRQFFFNENKINCLLRNLKKNQGRSHGFKNNEWMFIFKRDGDVYICPPVKYY